MNWLKTSTKTYVGKAYRVPSGYSHDPDTTAADVVLYEQSTLNNDLAIPEATLERLESRSANDLMWVTKTPQDAERYGSKEEIEEFDLTGEILAEDGDGGYLVLKSPTLIREEN